VADCRKLISSVLCAWLVKQLELLNFKLGGYKYEKISERINSINSYCSCRLRD
jgi:hypothetical protein